MIKIRTIRSCKLRIGVHYSFMRVVYNLLCEFSEIKEIVDILFAEFAELLNRELAQIANDRANPITEKMKATDSRIDEIVTCIRALIKIGLHSPDPAIAEAAKILKHRLKVFGYITNQSYAAESTTVQVLVKDLKTTYQTESALVGLTNWVNELDQAEQLFTTLSADRNASTARRPKGIVRIIRHDLEELYRRMLILIEADVIRNGDAKTAEFIRRLNKDIKSYNESLHHHKKELRIEN